MRVFCNGFNLYGQLKPLDVCVMETFQQVDNNQQFIENFQVNHSYSVRLHNNKLIFKGCVNDILEFSENFREISSNNDRVLLLDNHGKVHKINLDEPIISKLTEIPKFTNENETIIKIRSGAKITIAYTNNGNLYNIPNKLEFTQQNLSDIQVGRQHCILLDKQGNVYTFGSGSRGQLGLGHLEDEQQPRLVEALAGINIVQIAAGGWHSAALSKEGDLYMWGWNVNGQLGIQPVVSVMATPQVVDFEDSCRNGVRVACGGRHSIVLLDDNTIHGCGWNKYKQLKNDETENIVKFICLEKFVQDEIVDVKCGPWNSLVVCKN